MWVGFVVGPEGQVGLICISKLSIADCEVLAEKVVTTTKDCFISKSAFTAMLEDLVRQERKKRKQIEELMDPEHKTNTESSDDSEDNKLSDAQPTFHKTSLENYIKLVSLGSNVIKIHHNLLKKSSQEKHFFRAMISRTTTFIRDLVLCRLYL